MYRSLRGGETWPAKFGPRAPLFETNSRRFGVECMLYGGSHPVPPRTADRTEKRQEFPYRVGGGRCFDPRIGFLPDARALETGRRLRLDRGFRLSGQFGILPLAGLDHGIAAHPNGRLENESIRKAQASRQARRATGHQKQQG